VVSGRHRAATMAGIVVVAVGALAGCTSSIDPAPPAVVAAQAVGGVPTIPLASSSTAQSATWATAALGHLDDPLNTFWELFVLSSGSTGWELSTPPGVASNGGVVASIAGGTVLTGFEPSQDLLFSPLAQSTDQGASWSPGLLPAGLAPVPDSLATSGSGPADALLRSDGGRVVTTSGDLASWATIATTHGLASLPAAAKCSLQRLTAVASGPQPGSAIAAGVCARGGRPGLFLQAGRGWTAVAPAVPGVSSGPTEVIRLVTTSTGAVALVSAGSGAATSLYALRSTGGLKSWRVSSGLPLAGATLASTGVSADGGLVVAGSKAGHGGHGRVTWAATIGPSAASWQILSPPPSGTSAVVSTPTGSFEALGGRNSTLIVDSLGPGGWARIQTVAVPVQYGSSG
jgi:hypothetical protein